MGSSVSTAPAAEADAAPPPEAESPEQAESPEEEEEVASLIPTVKASSIDDFELLTTLGKGAFGRVRLGRHREDGSLWAIKMLKKSEIVENNAISHLHREKSVLMSVRHPFIVNLACAFHDEARVYLVLEFVQGGPFDTRLRGEGALSVGEASFYAAQIVLVLEYLHAIDYIYRDLKPDNLLFDMAGYVKLTDFGFAKKTTFTKTLCGTPDYMAPEIIQRTGYGKAVDWWALGVVLCEMLTGSTPFVADSHDATYDAILKFKPRWPSDLKGHGKAIVKSFITKSPDARLGAGRIKGQPFFKAINWDQLIRRQLQAPHTPFVNFPDDTSNFDEYPDSKDPPVPLCIEQGEQDPFADFVAAA